MKYEQITMFDGENKFINDKPIRLVELFAGYGSQSLALKYLGIPFEHYKISEWAVKSIQAYKDIHFSNDNMDYSKYLTIEQVREWLYGRISSDYNTPMTEQQINRLSEQKARVIYNNMQATHNLGSITKITSTDLNICDTDKFTYIMTYSFPCQDLSLAGQRKGMSKGNGTRSGLLWEVERLLSECLGGQQLPQILLMENVPQVHGTKNKQDFNKWCNFLESLGYKNYWQDLNAKDFEIPQNRNRCFMISLLGDYNFSFPSKMELQVRLKNFLDKQVDEKYYLSNKMIEYIVQDNDKWTGNNDKSIINRDIAVTINTRVGNVRCDSSDYICDNLPQNFDLKRLKEEPKLDVVCNLYEMGIKGFNRDTGEILSPNGICKTIQTMQGGNRQPKILETYLKTKNKRLISMLDKIDVSKIQAIDMYNQSVHKDTIQTITVGVNSRNCTAVTQDYRIRKLTEKECWRLMGVKEQDFENASKNQSMSSLYHLAGDSIVTTCLMAIFGELFDVDYNKKINDLVEELKQ